MAPKKKQGPSPGGAKMHQQTLFEAFKKAPSGKGAGSSTPASQDAQASKENKRPAETQQPASNKKAPKTKQQQQQQQDQPQVVDLEKEATDVQQAFTPSAQHTATPGGKQAARSQTEGSQPQQTVTKPEGSQPQQTVVKPKRGRKRKDANSDEEAIAAGASAALAASDSAFKEVEDSYGTVCEKDYLGIITAYREYADGSPLIQAGAEEESAGPSMTGVVPLIPAVTMATRSNSMRQNKLTGSVGGHHIANTDNSADNPRWEARGLQFVAAIRPLIKMRHGLSRTLQEFLIHIVLNHGSHHSDLSLRALRLLEYNLSLHPLTKAGLEHGVPIVLVNKDLWKPAADDQFRFEGERIPLALKASQMGAAYVRYAQLWRHAAQYCQYELPAPESELGPQGQPGALLFLSYCQQLLQQDLRVRLQLLEEHSGHKRAYLLLANCKLLRLLNSVSTSPWTCPGINHSNLVRWLVQTIITGSNESGNRALPDPASNEAGAAPAAGRNTQLDSVGSQSSGVRPAVPEGAAADLAGRASCPFSPAKARLMAAECLHGLGRLLSHMEQRDLLARQHAWNTTYFYSRNTHKATDCWQLLDELLTLLTGPRRGATLPADVAALAAQFKDHGCKLAVLRCLHPQQCLVLLALHFTEKAEHNWQEASLPYHLQALKEYRTERGLLTSAQVDPVQLLKCLLPAPTTAAPVNTQPTPAGQPTPAVKSSQHAAKGLQQEAEDVGMQETGTATETAEATTQPHSQLTPGAAAKPASQATGRKRRAGSENEGAVDFFDVATKMLFQAGNSKTDAGGCAVWLAAFITAAIQTLNQSEASASKDAAAQLKKERDDLKKVYSAVQQRLSTDADRFRRGLTLAGEVALLAAQMQVVNL